MKIVVMEPLGVKMEQINALAASLQAAGHDFVYYTAKETDQTKLLARVQQADIIMLANQPLSAEIINACPNLKMLSVAFTGVDHIALAACRERGILVCNAAGYSTNAVAELTFGLAISVIRNIVPCDARCRQAGTKDGLVGFELFGKTFGVVGTGAIGSRVARIAAAVGAAALAVAYGAAGGIYAGAGGLCLWRKLQRVCKQAAGMQCLHYQAGERQTAVSPYAEAGDAPCLRPAAGGRAAKVLPSFGTMVRTAEGVRGSAGLAVPRP